MSSEERPPPSTVWQAIDTYLRIAYEGAAPARITARLAELRACCEEAFYESPVFEREPKESPRRYALRLGNRHYPHMKLVVEGLPSQREWFFRADTHDHHARPEPTDPDHEAFCALMERNRVISCAVEAAWRGEGISTFQEFLRRDLERRLAGGCGRAARSSH